MTKQSPNTRFLAAPGNIWFRATLGMTFWVILSFVFPNNVVSGEVIGYDDVTAVGKVVKLRALTKGRLFSEGGRLVEFYIEKKRIGTTLSGGDGYALFEYLPYSSGIKRLKVKAGNDADEGVLLVIKKNDRVLLIEIEGVLFNMELRNLLHPEPVKGSKNALQRLSKKFRIVYLTTTIGLKKSREWLKDNGFPTSAVLKWRGVSLLDELQEKGLKLYAIIGLPNTLSESSEHIKKRGLALRIQRMQWLLRIGMSY